MKGDYTNALKYYKKRYNNLKKLGYVGAYRLVGLSIGEIILKDGNLEEAEGFTLNLYQHPVTQKDSAYNEFTNACFTALCPLLLAKIYLKFWMVPSFQGFLCG